MDSKQIGAALALVGVADEGLNVRDFRAQLSAILEQLPQHPVCLLNVRNRPTAVLVDLRAYRETLAKAEAYDRLLLGGLNREHRRLSGTALAWG